MKSKIAACYLEFSVSGGRGVSGYINYCIWNMMCISDPKERRSSARKGAYRRGNGAQLVSPPRRRTLMCTCFRGGGCELLQH